MTGPFISTKVAGFDGDNDVDLIDFDEWEWCLAGPDIEPDEDCQALDLDTHGDVDMADFVELRGGNVEAIKAEVEALADNAKRIEADDLWPG